MRTIKDSRAAQTFCVAMLMGVAIFLPFILYDGGYFLYYGDFNVQQIPFYRLAHEAVRSGDIFWNWYTDLGVNFIGSYSFYLLFSPFFWLTLPFPTAAVPFLMGPLLVLKTACAALTAHLYLRRFVKDARYAMLGALLYAFSGWMDFNIFFNHFHEVAVFFPLLLLGLERLVTEDRRGLFAAAVLINAMVNYWFFVGEVVFVLLYVAIRATDRSWGFSLKKFCFIAVESLLGVGCAAAAMLPSVLALMGNPRTGAEEMVSGWNVWLYWHEQRQPAILQSLIFPPELPARPNFLPDHGAKWSSLSAWLPLFSITGVLAYFFRRRDDWLKKILALSLLFALVPWLNSLFILLNDSYYARWFYMPVLLMALATVRELEDCAPAKGGDAVRPFIRAIRWSAIVLVAFMLMCGVTPQYKEDKLVIGLASDPWLMWIFSAIAMVCLLLVTLLVVRLRGHRRFFRITLVAVMVVSVSFNIFYMANGKSDRKRDQWMIDRAINGGAQISLPDDGTAFSRIDLYDATDNLGMYWHRPTIQAFHSIVPPSIMEFYPEVGVTRDVGSRPEADLYALRPLLSVRWLFIEESKEEQQPMPGYHYYDTQNGFAIYENNNYLPMGFAYDAYVTPKQMEDVSTDNRSNLMLRAAVLSEDAAARNADILQPMPEEGYEGFTPDRMEEDVLERRTYTADSFAFDNNGFTATTNFNEPKLLFFSVPWEKGWSASLAGQGNLPIEKVNLGFMAVRVPAGPQTIRFTYYPPGLIEGAAITGASLFLLALYLLIFRRKASKDTKEPDPNAELLRGHAVTMPLEEYQERMGTGKDRAKAVQKALEIAADIQAQNTARLAAEADAGLPEEERTLRFEPSDKPVESIPEREPAPSAQPPVPPEVYESVPEYIRELYFGRPAGDTAPTEPQPPAAVEVAPAMEEKPRYFGPLEAEAELNGPPAGDTAPTEPQPPTAMEDDSATEEKPRYFGPLEAEAELNSPPSTEERHNLEEEGHDHNEGSTGVWTRREPPALE